MGLHCPVEVGSPSSRAGSTLKAYPRAGTPSWPLRTYGHVHEKQGKCVPHDVGENVCVLRRAVARPAAWNWVYPGELFWAGVWAVGVPGPPSGSAGRGVKFRHPKVKWLTQTLPSELPSSRQRAVLCPLACTWNASKRVGWGPQGARLACAILPLGDGI